MPARALDLALRLFPLRGVHLRQGFGQPPAGASQDGHGHLQIARQFARGRCGGGRLPLRFQKQFRLGQDALANHARAFAPGRVQLPGLPCVATVPDESGRHRLALVRVEARHRHQILHGQLRSQLSLAHLLLNGFRQKLHQRQPPRYPAHAAIEPARQLLQRVAKASLHFRQQPALFERGLVWAESQRPLQQQSFGFAQLPNGGFDRVPAQLLEGREALVAVDDQVAAGVVWGEDHDDGCLLSRLSQRGHQPPLEVRLAHSQMLPRPVELVKLQLHRCLRVQYGPNRDWSFAAEGEVCLEAS